MNRLLGLCVLATTAISIITHRREIREAWQGIADMLPHPGLPATEPELPPHMLREVMSVTRP